jgi:hypothetical protein
MSERAQLAPQRAKEWPLRMKKLDKQTVTIHDTQNGDFA